MDYQTLYLVLFTTLLIQSVALLLTWRQNREEPGLRDWGFSAALMTTGSLLVMFGLFFTGNGESETPFYAHLLRDSGSGLAAAGWALAWLGIRRFYHHPAINYRLIPLFWIVFSLLLWPGHDLPGWRVTLIGFTIAICAGLIVWELQRIGPARNLITHMGSLAMIVVLAAWLSRALSAASDLQRASGASTIDLVCIYSSIVMSMVFTLSLILLTNQRVHQRLREQASADELTGALNRRAFFEASKPILARLQRDSTSLAIAVIDIDLFKKVNDNYGHATGDLVLRRFSRLAEASLREGDLFARYGGEEFVILFQNSSLDQATQAIERLRQSWSEQVLSTKGIRLRVTFSTGISHISGPRIISLDALLNSADHALYQAKRAGRDRTHLAGGDVTASTLSPA